MEDQDPGSEAEKSKKKQGVIKNGHFYDT